MPVFLFTIHSYRSWRVDNPRGYVESGKGILPPNERLAEAHDRLASEEPALFGPSEQQVLAWIAWDVCRLREWRLHGIAMEPTHAHLLVSWKGVTRMPSVCAKIKNLISLELNRRRAKSRKWLSRGASRKQVKNRRHFDHLMKVYLPKHGGLVWIEGMPPPEPPASADG